MEHSILLYGANGYTGRLIASIASDYEIMPILAGRSEASIKPMAEQLGLTYRIADLNDAIAMDTMLKDVKLVLHAAGPFRFTAKPMMEACVRNSVHYLDITGEIGVYEMAKKKYHGPALEKNILLMPGVGFDVVPTDCMALHLKNKMPDAIALKLAFAGLGGRMSQGTATTAAMGMGEKSAARKAGIITAVPLGQKGMDVNFGPKKIFVMSIPWGDVSTAFHTTGIPDIETYTKVPRKLYKILKFQSVFNWFLRTDIARNWRLKKIKAQPPGPSDEERARSISLIWGQVTNARGEQLEASMKVPEGYTLTAMSSLIIARKVLDGNYKPGYQTPAGCYGEELIFEVPGTELLSQSSH